MKKTIAYILEERMSWLAVSLYLIIGIVIYSNVILHGIFLFDDFEYVIGNDILQNYSFFNMSDPRQIGYISFGLNYMLGGDNPLGYHLVNVLIHIINAILVYFVVRMLHAVLTQGRDEAGRRYSIVAFVSGLLFLVHPVETQAVSYVTQRFTSLAALFYLVSVLAYLKARVTFENVWTSRKGYAWYGVSLLSTLLAMRTKEITFTIPFMLALFEYLLFSGSALRRRRFIYLIPYAALLTIIPLSILGPDLGLISSGKGVAEVTREEKLFDLFQRPFFQYLLTQFRVIVTYIRLLFLPIGQRAVYDYKVSRTLFDLRVLYSLGVLGLIGWYARILWRKSQKPDDPEPAFSKLASLGIIWFFLTLSIESSVIPIKDLIFEHRVYLPSVGFFAALSALAARAVIRKGILLSGLKQAAVGVAVVAVVLSLGVATYARNNVWTDEVKFWDDVVKKDPDKAIGYNNRGNAYGKLGEYDLALRDIDKTISLFPKDPRASLSYENADFSPSNMAKTYENRATIYYYLGKLDQAREDSNRARDLMSGQALDIAATLRIADIYAKKKAYKHAIAEYDKILQWDPENLDALVNRANSYSWTSNYGDAIRDLSRIILIHPDYALAYHNRGIAYAWSDRRNEAVADFQKACGLGFQPACESIEKVKRGEK